LVTSLANSISRSIWTVSVVGTAIIVVMLTDSVPAGGCIGFEDNG
jgi:hypothetical protein